jgi:hypothetical protein
LVLSFIPLLIGVAFGCNYNEDLSLFKYVKLIVSKPSRVYYSKPAEDLVQIHNAAERIKQEEELSRRQNEKMSDEQQKKFLIKVLIGGVVLIAVFIVVIIVALSLKSTEEVHHTVMLLYKGDSMA